MNRKILALFLSLLMILMNAPLALASGSDTTAPTVLGLQFNQTDYVVGDTMTITLQLDQQQTDLQPNFNRCNIQFATTDGTPCKFDWINTFSKIDNDTYVFSKTLTKDSGPSGTYQIDRITLEDLSGNSSVSNCYGLPAGTQSQFKFTNNERTDWTAPVLDSVDLSPNTVNVGEKVSAVVMAHDVSGLADNTGSIVISNVNNNYFFFDLRTDPNNPDRLTGTSDALSSDMPSGDYFVSLITMTDTVGNACVLDTFDNTLPTSMRKKVTIVNDNNPVEYNMPTIASIDIGAKTIKQGDPVDVTVTVDPNGNPLDNVNMVSSNIQPPNYAECGIEYTKTADDVYKSKTIMPVSLPTGDYYIINFAMCFMNQSGIGSGGSLHWTGYENNGTNLDSSGHLEKITVTSVFSGTDNVSVLQGTAFDPLADVTASNNTEGSMTSKIEVEAPANFSTDTVGVYLFKYKIKSSQTTPEGDPLYYYDFRWVGVTEVMPTDTGTGSTPLVVTNGSVAIGADSANASLSKNGKGIAFAGSVSSQGNYAISLNGSGQSFSALQGIGAAKSTGKSKANFVIDRSGPTLSETYQGVSPGSISVAVKAKDPSGVSALKWKKGSCSLSDVKANGTVFKGSFVAKSFGKYTVYARDTLGNESISVVNLVFVRVASVKLSSKSHQLTVGSKLNLTATVSPASATYKNVSWSSSNSAVATVDSNGRVTAVGVGKATITAKASNGKTANCSITVKPVQVVKVLLNKKTLTLAINGTFKLVATVTPVNSTNKTIQWTSSKPGVVSVDSAGNILALKKGTAYVYARSSNGKVAKCKVVVK